jgi:hypothetical protein
MFIAIRPKARESFRTAMFLSYTSQKYYPKSIISSQEIHSCSRAGNARTASPLTAVSATRTIRKALHYETVMPYLHQMGVLTA